MHHFHLNDREWEQSTAEEAADTVEFVACDRTDKIMSHKGKGKVYQDRLMEEDMDERVDSMTSIIKKGTQFYDFFSPLQFSSSGTRISPR